MHPEPVNAVSYWKENSLLCNKDANTLQYNGRSVTLGHSLAFSGVCSVF